jgi:hypothetical protein
MPFLLFLLFPVYVFGQKFTIDAQKNCIAPTSDVDKSFHEAAVGIDKGSKELKAGELYKVSLEGNAERSRGGAPLPGAIVFYFDGNYGVPFSKFLQPGESFVFRTPDAARRIFVEAAAIDGGATFDNSGTLTMEVSSRE